MRKALLVALILVLVACCTVAAAVTEFGMIVGDRERYHASYDQIQSLLSQTDIQDSYRQEFAELVEYIK